MCLGGNIKDIDLDYGVIVKTFTGSTYLGVKMDHQAKMQNTDTAGINRERKLTRTFNLIL